ncbi:hypothetical protein [Streptomyces sp. CA-179760]|uniref:hypothetical protein n=1 Tax=Streptomyces sp. CA-179760 TaxID=3240054 RepID=UPI003D93FCF0
MSRSAPTTAMAEAGSPALNSCAFNCTLADWVRIQVVTRCAECGISWRYRHLSSW